MDQRRLEPIRQFAENIRGAATTGAAHDHHAFGFVDPPGDFGDVGLAWGDFAARLQGRDAGSCADRLRGEHVLRKRQMRDAGTGIGGGDGLMNHRGCLRRR